jgi:2-oxoglutarate dehydrogenase E1 component
VAERSGETLEGLASLFSGENAPYVESLYDDYLQSRTRVPETWARIFDGLSGQPRPVDNGSPAPRGTETAAPTRMVIALVNSYRAHGHLIAQLDPLGRSDQEHPFLDPAELGLNEHMDEPVASSFVGCPEATPRELIEMLRETYCHTFAAEFMGIADKERRDWLLERMEPSRNDPKLSPEEKVRCLSQIVAVERFEQFLHRRFLGQKRFSLEGADSLIPILDTIIEDAAQLRSKELVLAMAHRGRLNVLAHTLGMPYRAGFSEFHTTLMPRDAQGSGDVKYHRGYSSDRVTRSGQTMHLSLCANPSHLEWIGPVAEGITRAKQNFRGDVERSEVITVLIHGDAAFNGQGVVAETLALSELESHWTGGTIHIIVNNQIGFTTEPDQYRFTRYPSDPAKVIQAPVFHVNSDDPEACVHAARLAIAFRQQFQEDVIIDLICYRRYGHNEGDDPTFTQPVLYKKIAKHPTVATLYTERLVREGSIDSQTAQKIEDDQLRALDRAFEQSREEMRLEGSEGWRGLWRGFEEGERAVDGRTAVRREVLDALADALLALPEGFHPHKKIQRLLDERARALRPGGTLDWGAGEAAALGSLLYEGKTVRMTGQDVERGTFSHRHAVLHDVETDDRYIPLNALGGDRASLIIANSMLSEAAVLGFEYGYSSVDPNRLTIWEAQFGDFSNCAQVIIDQFISSAEQKWNRSSGIVLLLPHGYEGQGPEHSSARLERFLQLCAEDNMQVCNLTTPAQIFHALRRQIHRSVRKPLIVMSPKSLLRHPRAVSPVEDLESGSFQSVIDDPSRIDGTLDPGTTRRVLFCSGKVFYTLLNAREENAFNDVAIVRIEELHPFPFDEVRSVLTPYAARDVVWVQEEPWNMGAWSYIQDRLRRSIPEGATVRYVGRSEAASTATGSYKIHLEQETAFVRDAFARHRRVRATTRSEEAETEARTK